MKKIGLILFIFVISSSFVFAENSNVIQSFKKIIALQKIEVLVPTVVEVVLPNEITSSYFAVLNETDKKFEPYVVTNNTLLDSNSYVSIPQKISSNFPNQISNVFDNSFQTYSQFDVDQDGKGYVTIDYSFIENVKSNSISLSLDQYVSLPNSITIKAIENGKEKIVLSQFKPTSNIINFPETSSNNWKFEINYSQPLRINELQIQNLNAKKIPTSLRFLAQPKKEYKIFAEPDLIINQNTSERPNLLSNDDVKIIQTLSVDKNQSYKLADTDNDTIPDINDNCVLIPNTDQADINQNNRGDVCDDFDKDGVINSEDNCINEPNANQADIDLDKIGDACDGIESRLTEKYPWLVWGGIIFAALLFLGLFAVAIRKIRFNQSVVEEKKPDINQLMK